MDDLGITGTGASSSLHSILQLMWTPCSGWLLKVRGEKSFRADSVPGDLGPFANIYRYIRCIYDTYLHTCRSIDPTWMGMNPWQFERLRRNINNSTAHSACEGYGTSNTCARELGSCMPSTCGILMPNKFTWTVAVLRHDTEPLEPSLALGIL